MCLIFPVTGWPLRYAYPLIRLSRSVAAMNNKMKQILPIVFAAITFASTATAYNPPTGPFATRFWDCCPAAFAWSSDKVAVHSPVDMCEKDGVTPIPQKSQLSGKNGCQGGNMFCRP